jgi:membrane fusion protein (multidrug efflux system)
MVVNAENVVEERMLDIVQDRGNTWVVREGLKDGDRLIVAGFQRIATGAPVTPEEQTAPAAEDEAAPAAAAEAAPADGEAAPAADAEAAPAEDAAAAEGATPAPVEETEAATAETSDGTASN